MKEEIIEMCAVSGELSITFPYPYGVTAVSSKEGTFEEKVKECQDQFDKKGVPVELKIIITNGRSKKR